MKEETEAELVDAARNGDVESFGRLYELYYASMVGVAYAVLGDRHLAEDAAQETFAIACHQIERLKRTDRFAGWLRGICTNVGKSIIRSRSRQVAAEKAQARTRGSPTDAFDQSVRRAVMELSRAGREVVLLHYFAGMSHKHIGAVLGVSPQAVHGRLSRARWKLGSRLKRKALVGGDHELSRE